ncbi:MAG TPA: prolyl oligopeptidase family serine peptidase [Thermoguttaceae bacterium]|nr:prolyl oligopeptidase family serine peptidase [Thermoguttaceae bacterium]
MTFLVLLGCLGALTAPLSTMLGADEPLPGTSRLTLPQDDAVVHARHMQQVEDYFQRRIEEARGFRDRQWKPDFSSAEAYEDSIAAHRVNCRKMLGLVDAKAAVAEAKSTRLAASGDLRIERISVPMFAGLSGRGLLFSPGANGPRAAVVVCADADTWPERFAGLTGDGKPAKWLTDLVARGAMVYVPQSIERLQDHPYSKTTNNKDRRMILYRLGYPVGRTMPGLDVQDVLAAVDYLLARDEVDPSRLGLVGIGQGGMTALFAAAVDRRVSAVAVADYFQVRDHCWQEPVDRRLARQLLEFGDAELAGLVAPRPLRVVHSAASAIPKDRVMAEIARASRFYSGLRKAPHLKFAHLSGEDAAAASTGLLAEDLGLPEPRADLDWPAVNVSDAEAKAVRDKHFEERLACLRTLIAESEAKRDARWRLAKCSRSEFDQVKAAMLKDYRELVSHVPTEGTPINPKTELALATDKYKLYRITLDVTPGVEVYGNLLVPRDIKGRAAAVICQHGLSGTPEMTTGLGMTKDTAYHEFARHLAEHGYVVFSPYLMQRRTEEINVLVRQADAVGMMRVAMPVAKTRRVVDFLETLPFVDAKRIGYYGLSYGGYSAIWISPLEPRLAATVISGHFNDWRSKITNDTLHTSYLWHPDEDFYNWDILHRFTHVELVAMIAPRPACIEFGERDGITTPEWTAYAWKQVVGWRDPLGLADRITLAHYDGVHEIHAVEAIDFLDRFLRPTRPVGRDYEATRVGPDGREPFVTQVLDSRRESRIGGRFWIASGGSQFRGMAMRLSRVGQPAPLEVRFGSRPGSDDLGTATLLPEAVQPDGHAWCTLRIDPRPVEPGVLVYYDIGCTGGTASEDHYVVYGPRPIGGKDWPNRFALSYRVLTDRPEDGSP